MTAPSDDPTDDAPSSAASVPFFLVRGSQWAWRSLVIVAALYVLLRTAAILRVVVLPVFIALVATALLVPAVDWLAHRMPRLAATWLTILASLGTIAAVFVWASRPLSDAVRDLSMRSDDAATRIRDWLTDGPLGLESTQVDSLFTRISEAADQAFAGVVDQPASTARLAFDLVAGLLLAIVLTFFFLRDGSSMWSWIVDRLRVERRQAVDESGRAALASLQGWVRGTAITGVVDGLIIGLALLLLDVPAALPLAVITFFGAFIPIIGATAAGALAAAVALADAGPGKALAVAAVVLVVQQVEGDVLLPLVMQRQVSLHPAVILLVLAVGGAVAGIVGALVAVPVTASVVAAVSAIRSHDAERSSGGVILPSAADPTT